MGLTIICAPTGSNIDMSYGSFSNLRCKIAMAFSPDLLGPHYCKMYEAPLKGKRRNDFFDRWDKEWERITTENAFDMKVIDFLLEPDCDGIADIETCGKVYEIVKNFSDKESIVHLCWEHPYTVGDFKRILLDCIENNCEMEWYGHEGQFASTRRTKYIWKRNGPDPVP